MMVLVRCCLFKSIWNLLASLLHWTHCKSHFIIFSTFFFFCKWKHVTIYFSCFGECCSNIFAVKLQNCSVIYTSDFTSTWVWIDNDWSDSFSFSGEMILLRCVYVPICKAFTESDHSFPQHTCLCFHLIISSECIELLCSAHSFM